MQEFSHNQFYFDSGHCIWPWSTKPRKSYEHNDVWQKNKNINKTINIFKNYFYIQVI